MLWKIGIVGFGNVGQGLAHILNRKKEILKRRYDFEYIMTFIADPVRGSLYNENGLDLDSVLKEMALKGSLKNRPEFTDKGTLELIEMAKADIVAEATITNFETGEPGLSHMRKALSIGSHVVTSNKGTCARDCESSHGREASSAVGVGATIRDHTEIRADPSPGWSIPCWFPISPLARG